LTTYDSISGSQKIYINGILEKSDTAAVLSGTDDDNWGVGRKEYNDSEYFNGLIDEVKIYPYALSEDEIKLEYNRGAAIVAGSTSTASNGTTPDNSAAREYCVPGDTSTCNPPVAEWKFDENTGTTANDSSGNNNTGTLTTSPTWTTGKTGSGVNLSPSNSYVSVADSSSLNITGDLTISTWVKPNAVDSTARLIMGKGNTSATTSRQYGMRLSAANQWQAFVYSGSTTYSVADTTTTPSTSRWDQLTVVRDATANTLKFYTNGILRGSASSVTGSLNSTNNIFAIGREGSSASNYFGGMVDNMRIYNYARTPAQVAWEYNRGGPIAHYKLDECQGTTANNSALFGSETAGNNGTITIGASGSNTSVGSCKGSGGEAWKTGASGKFNSSLSFDGTDDYLDIPDTTQLNFSTTTPYSLSVWVQKASDGVTQVVLDKRTAENTGYSIFIGSDNQVYFRSTNLTDLVSTATITGTDWHHLLVTDNRGGTRQLFIDGQLAASDNVTTSSNSLSATTTLRLARNSTAGIGNYYFAGQIDDVRIYNYPLTALQIKDIYTGGAVNFR
jgi:hypothetical protein